MGSAKLVVVGFAVAASMSCSTPLKRTLAAATFGAAAGGAVSMGCTPNNTSCGDFLRGVYPVMGALVFTTSALLLDTYIHSSHSNDDEEEGVDDSPPSHTPTPSDVSAGGPAPSAPLGQEALVASCREGSAYACTMACQGYDGTSCEKGAELYKAGKHIGVDEKAAAAMYVRACSSGSSQGCAKAAEMYERGEGVAPNAEMAAYLDHRGCAAGDSSACEKAAKRDAATTVRSTGYDDLLVCDACWGGPRVEVSGNCRGHVHEETYTAPCKCAVSGSGSLPPWDGVVYHETRTARVCNEDAPTPAVAEQLDELTQYLETTEDQPYECPGAGSCCAYWKHRYECEKSGSCQDSEHSAACLD